MRNLSVTGMALLLAALLACGCSGEEQQQAKGPAGPQPSTTAFVTIGTGAITGVYYPTGGAIAKIVNAKKKVYNLRCAVESTAGSVFNVNAVIAGDFQFGIVQSDRQYQAVRGLAEWKDKGPQRDLRSCFAIHPESVTLVAAVDSGIQDITDLRGKRVNIGNPGSGQRQNAIDALQAVGIDYRSDLTAEGIKASESAGLLQEGRIDAFFYTVGHPSDAIKEATLGRRRVRLAAIREVDELLGKHPYYARSVIPVKFYPNLENTQDVDTFGVKATFVTSAKTPVNIVYAVVKEVFDNFENFKSLHPAYAVLTRENMIEGLTAEFHPGALKYFKEAGLVQ